MFGIEDSTSDALATSCQSPCLTTTAIYRVFRIAIIDFDGGLGRKPILHTQFDIDRTGRFPGFRIGVMER